MHYIDNSESDDITSAVHRLQHFITDIGCWMSANRLKLNTDKTELLWIGSRYNLSVLQGCGPVLRLGSDVVERTHRLRTVTRSDTLQTSLSTDTSPIPAHVASTG